MAEPDWDVVVVGAGIQGAGIAQALAAAGYRVTLLERAAAPAQATSSRSSKLIHDGLRYLESGQLALVRECLHERGLLLRNAPGLVRLAPFHIPVYAGMRRGRLQLHAGLALYALLGRLAREARYTTLPAAAWGDLDGLATDGLRAVFRYYDGQTDDAALTRAVVDSAVALGCELRLRCEVTAVERLESQVRLACTQDGAGIALTARALVNATGPWVNQLLARTAPRQAPLAIEWIAGTHILLPGELHRGMYYVEAPRDGRAVFVMPWKGQTLVGTTERPYTGEDPGEVAPSEDEIGYLCETYAHYFPRNSTRVLEAFAGLRVLPRVEAAAFHRSRETLLTADDPHHPRLLSIVGGKLTAYRATAERVLALLRRSLPPRLARADTRRLPLGGAQ